MTTITKQTLMLVAAVALCGGASARAVATAPAVPVAGRDASTDARIERGAYLVRTMGCNDCHTPWVMGPRGPEPDMSRALTGHPADVPVPEAPALPVPWAWAAIATNTAFAGPWGISFPANLTPDMETGLGRWTEEMFIATMRTGRHEGKGRPLLPPMPYPVVAQLTDEDISALFAYLQSLPPVRNRVPAPVDPPDLEP